MANIYYDQNRKAPIPRLIWKDYHARWDRSHYDFGHYGGPSAEEHHNPIAEQYGVNRMCLFGSYARGDTTSDSDVDFLIERGDIHDLSLSCKNTPTSPRWGMNCTLGVLDFFLHVCVNIGMRL